MVAPLVVASAWFGLDEGPRRAKLSAEALASMTLWQRLDYRCGAEARAKRTPYPWPLAPFDRQHPVRGYFGDPRTVFSGSSEGAFSFHNGIDISAWAGNTVYPVVSGKVVVAAGNEVIVASSAYRRFQYIHLLPLVHVGDSVEASQTVLGYTLRGFGHIHLTEIRDGCVVNPLAPGHLSPYRDATRPEVRAIVFEDAAGRHLTAGDLAGKVRVIAEAQDEPALPAPGKWGRMPVTPAMITWRLATIRGQVVRSGVAADFRYSEPAVRNFCAVYAPGTVQNFAAIAGVYRWAHPGRYMFELMPRLLDTSKLEAGRYTIGVTARTIDGRSATRTATIRIGTDPPPTPSPPATDRRCQNAGLKQH